MTNSVFVFEDVEEYDPTQPMVSAPPSQDGSNEDMDTRVDDDYDPIVSAYSRADANTLNAEDAPGTIYYTRHLYSQLFLSFCQFGIISEKYVILNLIYIQELHRTHLARTI